MIDKQKIFDAGYLGLKAQGFERSVETNDLSLISGHLCLYRSDPPGKKCVIGFSIPDEDYQIIMEGRSPSQSPIIEILGSTEEEMTLVDENFLDQLQDVHDTYVTPGGMEGAMEQFADDWDLTIPKNE